MGTAFGASAAVALGKRLKGLLRPLSCEGLLNPSQQNQLSPFELIHSHALTRLNTGTTAGVYAIGTLFAVGGTSLTGYHMNRRVGSLEEFYFMRLSEVEQLSVTICVSGWAPQNDAIKDYVTPWRYLDGSSDTFCCVWEREAVHKLTKALTTMLIHETLKHTILVGILSAIAWPAALLKASRSEHFSAGRDWK